MMSRKSSKEIIVNVQTLYPSYGIRATLINPTKSLIEFSNHYEIVDLMINSVHAKQKKASQEALESLMNALNIKLPELAKHQPAQIVAASYTRLLQRYSWHGSLFSTPLDKLPILEFEAEPGISEHHHKKFNNYYFSSINKTINRNELRLTYTPSDSWWYQPLLHPKSISDIPDDFLLWFDKDKHDRGDQDDYPLLSSCLGIKSSKLMRAVFYQVKFEIADVLCCPPFYGQLPANIPANIFSKDVNPNDSLTGLMFNHSRHWITRPTTSQIYWAGVKGMLPNKAWNGKWVSNHQR